MLHGSGGMAMSVLQTQVLPGRCPGRGGCFPIMICLSGLNRRAPNSCYPPALPDLQDLQFDDHFIYLCLISFQRGLCALLLGVLLKGEYFWKGTASDLPFSDFPTKQAHGSKKQACICWVGVGIKPDSTASVKVLRAFSLKVHVSFDIYSLT